MTTLTRRRSDNPHQETWLVYFGDVRVGAIGRRAGLPIHAPQWCWSCGFYPGLGAAQHSNGIADSFDEARDAFERAWDALLPSIPADAFDDWRQNRDFHAWKDRMWAAKLPLPTQRTDGRARCFCGVAITLANSDEHIRTAHQGFA